LWCVYCGLFADRVAGCWAAVAHAFGSARAGPAGFWRAGRTGGCVVDAGKPAADPAWGQPARLDRFLPWAAQVVSEVSGQTELGVGGQDQPGPPVGLVRMTQPGSGPAQGLLEESEGVFQVEAAQE